jgi:predicted XRE-type DNA-binding protein
MHKDNFQIRAALKRAGLHQWQLAELLGVSDTTLCRYLRYKLSKESIKAIINIIQTHDTKEVEKTRTEIRRDALLRFEKSSFEVNDFIPYEDRILEKIKSHYGDQKEFEKNILET